MSCKCNNCNGVVSAGTSLPIGCTAILDITSVIGNDSTVVTITLCDGSIRQFVLPHGTDGVNGNVGAQGPQGNPGVGIQDVSSDVVGNILNLTFTLTDGSTFTETINLSNIIAGSNAYMVTTEFVPTAVGNEITLTTADQVLAEALIPGNTFVNFGDTLFFELVYRVILPNTLSSPNIFRTLGMSYGPSGYLGNNNENFVVLNNPQILQQEVQLHFKGQITFKSESGGSQYAYILVLDTFNRAEDRNESHSINMPSNISTYGMYGTHILNIDETQTNRLQLIGSIYSVGTKGEMIYFTTRRIPMI